MTKEKMIEEIKNGFSFITIDGSLVRVLYYDADRDKFFALKTHPTTPTLAPQVRMNLSYDDLYQYHYKNSDSNMK